MEWINATLISNGINMNLDNSDLLAGILRTLVGSGKAIQIQDYVDVAKEGQIDINRIEAHF